MYPQSMKMANDTQTYTANQLTNINTFTPIPAIQNLQRIASPIV